MWGSKDSLKMSMPMKWMDCVSSNVVTQMKDPDLWNYAKAVVGDDDGVLIRSKMRK